MWEYFKKFPILPLIIVSIPLIRLNKLGWPGYTALALATVWFCVSLIRWLMHCRDLRKQERVENAHFPEEGAIGGDPLISLVYFLDEAREADEEKIRDCFSRALEIKFDPSDENASEFVIDINPPKMSKGDRIQHFMVRIPSGLFNVLISKDPYIENPKEFAKESIRDKRLRSAVERHGAWISVDLMGEKPVAERRDEAYQIIGKALAAMAGPDCRAIYSPELQRCNEFDLNLIDVLQSNDPLALFDEPTFEPVIEVSEDDPRMSAAVEEAIERWDEFVVAFAKRTDPEDDRYIVKAEFCEGSRSEFMWVLVTGLENEKIIGSLMNDPHELVGVHRGSPVEINLDRLNDWICPGDDEEAMGGFTLKILTEED